VNKNSGCVGSGILVLDTAFVLHYFSDGQAILAKTRKRFKISRKLGNRVIPAIVLVEFYAQTYKRTGRHVAAEKL
jgi:hypothetical protein